MILEPVCVRLSLRSDGETWDAAVRRFEMVERIDHPYEATLELVSDDLDLDVRSFVGTEAVFELDRPGVGGRTMRGVVTRSEYVSTRSKQLFCKVVVEPSLALLRYSTRRRIFTDSTVLEVLTQVAEEVFGAHGGAWDASRLASGDLDELRDYVVQYDETDLAFVLRLLGEAGVSLLNAADDGEQGEVRYVLVDHNEALPSVGGDFGTSTGQGPVEVPFVPHAEEEAEEPSVQYLGRADGLHCRGVTASARAWKTAGGQRLQARAELEPSSGRTGHAWSFAPYRISEGKGSAGPQLDATSTWAMRRLEEVVAGSVHVEGQSNIAAFTAGATFELDGHPHTDLDQGYAVLSVVHQADFPEVEVGHVAGAAPTYVNRFVAAPLATGPVRPPLPSKPRVAGMESATVVGPEGEEVHTDALGRVQVRFAWDDAPSQTCWLRVMSAWAGAGYGVSFIPRVGMDVVVSFLGGDPDRPVVVGCLYTGTNVPPGVLPESKTCTTIRTQSSPSAGEDSPGYNELRFEDARGSEEVLLHAQRNHRTVVRATQSTRVGASRSLSVGKDSQRSIGGSETVQVGTPNADEKGELEVFVTGGELRHIGDVHALETTSAFWLAEEAIIANAEKRVCWSCTSGPQALDRAPSGGTVLTLTPTAATIEALESIELKVGDSSVLVSPRGVFIDGPVFTATPTEHVEVSAPGGSLTLRQEDAVLRGGAGQESSVSLSSEQLECKAKAKLRVEGAGVTVHGVETARVVAQEAQVEGVAGLSMTCVGETVVRGSKVRIN
ncbi:MAG: type VI secretion system tip protein TssI/VgrG [Myxococcota bacterium]